MKPATYDCKWNVLRTLTKLLRTIVFPVASSNFLHSCFYDRLGFHVAKLNIVSLSACVNLFEFFETSLLIVLFSCLRVWITLYIVLSVHWKAKLSVLIGSGLVKSLASNLQMAVLSSFVRCLYYFSSSSIFGFWCGMLKLKLKSPKILRDS